MKSSFPANGKRYAGMPSVTGDQFLHQLFPHKGVPYIVWIKDGKVINTTDAEQVTEKTICEILGNQRSSLQTVVQIDKTRRFLKAMMQKRTRNYQPILFYQKAESGLWIMVPGFTGTKVRPTAGSLPIFP
ncbi:hypothetical protein [uncultured Chryseobacterium sp.]|uniref:hypothetical protein n=1 Tax=uncultured Chryseobacterium sp. TaxID=259322 RepID=UPI0025F4D827|nr:hypothetical protein [uncultured Chryseobacterium sp.]